MPSHASIATNLRYRFLLVEASLIEDVLGHFRIDEVRDERSAVAIGPLSRKKFFAPSRVPFIRLARLG
jgi:hypothetical protein